MSMKELSILPFSTPREWVDAGLVKGYKFSLSRIYTRTKTNNGYAFIPQDNSSGLSIMFPDTPAPLNDADIGWERHFFKYKDQHAAEIVTHLLANPQQLAFTC